MRILFRHKKKEMDGFKNYCQSLETMRPQKRTEAFLNATLEDPIYMEWISKNIVTIHHIIELPQEELEEIITHLGTGIKTFARALHQSPLEQKFLSGISPKLVDKYNAEQENLQVTELQKEECIFSVIKSFRKLQSNNKIQSHQWRLPELQVVKTPMNRGVSGDYRCTFENGITACEGPMKNDKRIGDWIYYYTSGDILAEGSYEKNIKEGLWTFYYINGKKRLEGEFKEDIRYGEWKEWNHRQEMNIIDYNKKKAA